MIETRESPESDSLAADDSGLGIGKLNARLTRYSAGKLRALHMSDYIKQNMICEWSDRKRLTDFGRLAHNIYQCGSYLLFRNYYQRDEVRLHSAQFCKKHLLCPFCAMRRGTKYLMAYKERLSLVMAQNSRLRAFMVTLTVKDGEDLLTRFEALRSSLKRYQRQRRDASAGKRPLTEYNKALGGVFSIEVKRGQNSGLWHPHVHMIWLCEQEPDARALSREWHGITGDSYIVDVREFYGDSVIEGFMEVFKYALKFSDMELADNWHAFETLKGKRLVDSFGLLRGVEVSDDLSDGELEDDYFLMLYRFFGSAYFYVGSTES